MNFSKKLLLGIAFLAMVTVSCIPATFSWYSHINFAVSDKMSLAQNDLPVSVKSAENTISSVTYLADANGQMEFTDKSGQSHNKETVTSISVTPAEIVKYYKTVLKNTGDNDVMVDLGAPNMPNDADFYIGTVSPTLNEKAYASRAERSKVSDNTVRIYFKTCVSFENGAVANTFWNVDNGTLEEDLVNHPAGNNSTTNDINIAFTVNDTMTVKRMTKCSGTDNTIQNTTTAVYYYDVPINASSFFFFNHWYLKETSNQEWNRTIDITDFTAGRLYYLTGGNIDSKWKEYAVKNVDTDLVAVNQYYSSVRMSHGVGVFTDIALRKTGDDENFVPEYYGQSISYTSNDTDVATVNRDGIITPVGYGSAVITTTITGKYGDTRVITTNLDIPQNIPQISIIKNVKVPAGETVEVDWYALNKSTSETMTTGNIYFTL